MLKVIHSNFYTNGGKRDLLSEKFGMLLTCKTETKNVAVASP